MCQSYDKQPYTIRRMLTEGAVRASDKRAQFIGVDAYVEAGGTVLNDLFQGDDGGWLQDVGLIDMMVAEKLNEASVTIGAEGWKWVEVAPDFAYGHTYGLRQIRGETVPFTPEEEATLAALQQEVDDIETASAEAEELTEEQDQRMGELETAIEALNARPVVSTPTRSSAPAPSSASPPTVRCASSVATSGPRTSCRSSPNSRIIGTPRARRALAMPGSRATSRTARRSSRRSSRRRTKGCGRSPTSC